MPRPLWDQRGRRSTPQYPCVCSTPCALALVFLHALVYGPTSVVRARHAHVDRSFVLSPFQSQRNGRSSISGGPVFAQLVGDLASAILSIGAKHAFAVDMAHAL